MIKIREETSKETLKEMKIKVWGRKRKRRRRREKGRNRRKKYNGNGDIAVLIGCE
jgi:hypothetical protein